MVHGAGPKDELDYHHVGLSSPRENSSRRDRSPRIMSVRRPGSPPRLDTQEDRVSRETAEEYELKGLSKGSTTCSSNDTAHRRRVQHTLLVSPTVSDPASMTPRQRQMYYAADLLKLTSSPPTSNVPGQQSIQELSDELLSTYPQQETLRSLSRQQRNKIADSMFKSFVMELSIGKTLPQLTGTLDVMPFLLSVSQDLQRLVITQRDGAILEFPLMFFVRAILQKRSRRKKEEISRARKAILTQMLEGCEHEYETDCVLRDIDLEPDWLVFTDFTYRRLAFVFQEETEALRFKACLLLLVQLSQVLQEQQSGLLKQCECSDQTLGCLKVGRQSGNVRDGSIDVPARSPKSPGILPAISRLGSPILWSARPISAVESCSSYHTVPNAIRDAHTQRSTSKTSDPLVDIDTADLADMLETAVNDLKHKLSNKVTDRVDLLDSVLDDSELEDESELDVSCGYPPPVMSMPSPVKMIDGGGTKHGIESKLLSLLQSKSLKS